MTVIGFVRHGNTDWNRERRAQGHTDVPLNALGRQQAEAIGKRLEHESWDIIISSDLSRAWETAVSIGSYMNKKVVADQRLREISLGQVEGTTEEERIAKWGKDWRQLSLGMETTAEIQSRGVGFIEDCVRRYAGQRILAVSHGGLISNTLDALFPNEERAHVENTSYSIIRFNEDRWECLLYNCIQHLESI